MSVVEPNAPSVQKPLSAEDAERARTNKFSVRIPGRYMLADKREYPCATTAVSPIALDVECETTPSLNERIVLYLRDLGRIEGKVFRVTSRGFAVVMELTAAQRSKIEAHVHALANRHRLGSIRERRHERIFPLHRFCVLKLQNNEEHVVQLIDVSLSGTAFLFRTDALRKIPVGSPLILGKRSGRVVRKIENGIAVEFDKPLDVAEFDESIVL
jgi:hypothetical protein